MKKVYHCFRCGKWFEHPIRENDSDFGNLELCPGCGMRVYPCRGAKRALVVLAWWVWDFLKHPRRILGRR